MKQTSKLAIGLLLTLLLLCQVARSQIRVQSESSEEFKRLFEIKIGKPVVINEKPLRTKTSVTITNKSLWFIDIDSKSKITVDGLSPREKKTFDDVILEQGSALQLSFKSGYLTRGLTYKKNLLNSLWLGATGEPIPDISKALEPMLREFGPDLLLEYLEKNPQIVLSKLVELRQVPPQTTIAQFNTLQEYFGKLGGVVSILGALLKSPNQAEAIDQWWLVNRGLQANLHLIGSSEKPELTETVLLDEDFENFTGWNYTFDNNDGASLRTNGILSVSEFGKQQGGRGQRGSWYGAIATKEISEPLDINRDDFSLRTYLSSQDNLEGALGIIWIVLMDRENTPLVGVYWSDNWHEGGGMGSYFVGDPIGNDKYGHNSFLGLYTNDGIKGTGRHGGFESINGKVNLTKSAGQLSLFYAKDEGKPLIMSPTGAKGIADKIKIFILKYGEFPARDMKVDYLKLVKRK